MEANPLYTATDPEHRNLYEDALPPKDTGLSIEHGRHIARGALMHEELSPTDKDESFPPTKEHIQPELSGDGDDRFADLERVITFEHPRNRQKAPEAHELHGEKETGEHIGQVVINTEASEPPAERHEAVQPERPQEASPTKRAETMSRPELLAHSDHIVVEGTSLRQIYETHLIGEQALRRLVAEYLSGLDIRGSLQREILEHEIDFERDPALRDMAVPTNASDAHADQVVAPGKEALDRMFQKAEAVITPEHQSLSYDTTPHRLLLEEHGQRKRGHALDVAMATTIIVLLILVIALYFWRH